MKRFALVISLLALALVAQLATAGGYGHSYGYSYGYSTVRAFTFQPTYAVQSFAYATYQPFALYALPPVVQVQRVEQTVEVPATTYQFAAPVDPCPQTYQLFQAAPVYNYSGYSSGPTYSNFQFQGGYNHSGNRGNFANVNVSVDARRFRARQFNDVNVNVQANGFRGNNGATVIQNTTIERGGLLGRRRSVNTNTTVINGGNVSNSQTLQRSRLR
jgi:hypothetical protein